MEACLLYKLNLMRASPKGRKFHPNRITTTSFPHEGRVQVLEEQVKNRLTYFEAHEVSKEFLRKLKCFLLLERPVIPINFCSGKPFFEKRH